MTTNHHTLAILFVDDEEKARKMFTRLVSTEFEVLTAADVPQAKQILKEQHDRIGVLISDQRMPGEYGVDLLRFVREEYPKIIRMLTTAYSDLEDAIAAVNTGEIFRYVNKPWNADELLIDLRLAMKVFELEQDRLQLIQEKISLSQRQSKMEMMKSIITMMAAQTLYNCPRLAVKSFLEQLADPQRISSSGNDNANPASSFWEKELNKTEKLIKIARSLNTWSNQARHYLETDIEKIKDEETEQVDTDIYSDVFNKLDDKFPCQVTLTVDGSLPSSVLDNSSILHDVIAVIVRVLASDHQKKNEISIDVSADTEVKQTTLISVSSEQPTNWLATHLFTPGDEQTEKTLGELLGVFAMIYHYGGTIDMHFDQDMLTEICLTLPPAKTKTCDDDLTGGIWIEDLYMLFN